MAIEILRPNAAGDLTQLYTASPPNWDAVNDVTPDEDATYVEGDYYGGGERDLYNLPSSSGVGVINKITITCRCRNQPLYIYDRIRTMIKTGGTIYEGSDTAPTTSYVNYQTVYTLNPKTGLAWTWADIDALQIGVYLHASNDSASVRSTQVYVEIDYIPYTDIGIRVHKAAQTIKIGVQALEASHKLRIRKGGTTYGIPLLAISDSNASPVRIYDGSAIKALPRVD